MKVEETQKPNEFKPTQKLVVDVKQTSQKMNNIICYPSKNQVQFISATYIRIHYGKYYISLKCGTFYLENVCMQKIEVENL